MRFRTSTSDTSSKIIMNNAGGLAYTVTPELELLFVALTSFFKDKFYESADTQIERVRTLINSITDKKFVAKVAIFARNEFGMRTISHILAVELIMSVKNEAWVKNAVAQIIRRPDDMLEIVAYYFHIHKDVGFKKGLPASLRKGIQLALSKFNEYQLAKYRGAGSSVKMVDIVNLVHPKPTEFNKDLLKKLMLDELVSVDTWEATLSAAGQHDDEELVKELKKAGWKKLIEEKKLGYFALLRNLRNILKQAPEALDGALELLTQENLIKKSLVLPFRYLTALEQIQKLKAVSSHKVIKALNKAADIALANMPKFKGSTLIALDVSGSMAGMPITIGSLFAAALFKSDNADLLLFSDDAHYYSPNAEDSVLSLAQLIKSKAIYGGTNFHAIFTRAQRSYDRVIILSDMQGWMGGDVSLMQTVQRYQEQFFIEPFIYSFDLNGYGSLQFPQNRTVCVAGFSEKIFDVIKSFEEEGRSLLQKVNAVTF